MTLLQRRGATERVGSRRQCRRGGLVTIAEL
jgi:hypothetical protein